MTETPTPEETAHPNRRAAIGAGVAALGGAAIGSGVGFTAAKARQDNPAALPNAAELDDNLGKASHLFHLSAEEPLRFNGGTLQGAHEGNFPVLAGQQGSVYLVHLEPGGIREPHWHPTAWELNYVISGTTQWTILGTHPDGSYRKDVFEAHQGDLIFAPQGYFHYFENHTDNPLDVLVIFNTSAQEPNDDIGIVGTLNSIPRDVLAVCLGIPESTLNPIPTDLKPIVITKRPR
ncbi:cupin domain-containing protein [Nocardia brasiliensis]|uniref:cupin domain-containing protein n=1 Tax=Nocardia brasiliensis TaxID=37326 RepID=UPI001894A15A|nr:cupin domain-containing protein [Nocardia brasiliensis]MBF6125589.1 cupin domain-containing protein [Nocardia brasiliensis]